MHDPGKPDVSDASRLGRVEPQGGTVIDIPTERGRSYGLTAR
jgi:hypothetical protein